jgi:hypothetical protein
MNYALTGTPMLALLTFSERFKVICDASIVGIGVIILKKLLAFEN